jgi:hypothetical protein
MGGLGYEWNGWRAELTGMDDVYQGNPLGFVQIGKEWNW